MATLVASVRPAPPIIAMYIHEIVRMLALPYGAAETGPTEELPIADCQFPIEESAGRNGTRCFATPIGPTPGPPPPCGMQNVLCKFKWQTSAPKSPGRQRPTCAFIFAPSM